jgi:phosphatidylinositol phospholipase C, beta
MVAEQTKEWTDMVMRQMADEHDLLKSHVSQLTDLLRELMEDAQDLQLKELEIRQEKYEIMLFTY